MSANTLLECVKNLFGDLDETKVYSLCELSCLCVDTVDVTVGVTPEEPLCTDSAIIDRFCPREWFEPVVAAVVTAVTASTTTPTTTTTMTPTTTTTTPTTTTAAPLLTDAAAASTITLVNLLIFFYLNLYY